MQRRLPGDRIQFEKIHAGLASVPLAVAASSAFPAFFPPIRLRAADIGASGTAFSQQTFTDGGVFDNLGVRAFRFIERCWSEECRPTEAGGREIEVEQIGGSSRRRDLAGRGRAQEAGFSPSETPEPATVSIGNDREGSSSPGRDLARRSDHHRATDSPSALLGPPGAENGQGHRPGRGSLTEFDGVLVSDAGAKLATHHDFHSGGFIRTALRSSDILMDRVWQLEKEIFGATPGFLFAPIHQIVELEQDPDALQPVIQRQVIGIRTDLDGFSPVEIRTLVQHGYCVTRQACQLRPSLFGDDLPAGKPWDPCPPPNPPSSLPPGRPGRPPAEPTKLARELQQSAVRRIVSTLLDWRDGMTYLFLPVLMVVLLAFPTLLVWSYLHISRDEKALGAISASDPDQSKVIGLLRKGPVKSLEGMPVRDVDRLEMPDYRGFSILSDGHIVDLRADESGFLPWSEWRRGGIYQYRHFLVRKLAVAGADDHLRFQFTSEAARFSFRCHNPDLHPVLKRMRVSPAATTENGPMYRLELDLDFRTIPVNANVDVLMDGLLRDNPGAERDAGRPVPHATYGDTKLATMWILLPQHRHAGRLELIAYPRLQPQEKRSVRPTRQFEAHGGSVLGWQIIGPDPDTTYEGHWVLD